MKVNHNYLYEFMRTIITYTSMIQQHPDSYLSPNPSLSFPDSIHHWERYLSTGFSINIWYAEHCNLVTGVISGKVDGNKDCINQRHVVYLGLYVRFHSHMEEEVALQFHTRLTFNWRAVICRVYLPACVRHSPQLTLIVVQMHR